MKKQKIYKGGMKRESNHILLDTLTMVNELKNQDSFIYSPLIVKERKKEERRKKVRLACGVKNHSHDNKDIKKVKEEEYVIKKDKETKGGYFVQDSIKLIFLEKNNKSKEKVRKKKNKKKVTEAKKGNKNLSSLTVVKQEEKSQEGRKRTPIL